MKMVISHFPAIYEEITTVFLPFLPLFPVGACLISKIH